MKKTFSFKSSNKTPERQADSIKHEIKKYIARERRKELPENVDFWDFDCKIGEQSEGASDINIAEVSKLVSNYLAEEKESFYLEILAKPGYRKAK